MPVQEIAVLSIKPNLNLQEISENLVQGLGTVVEVQTKYSQYPTLIRKELGNERNIVLIGGWDSVKDHEDYIQTEPNQKLLQIMSPYIDVTFFLHSSILPQDSQHTLLDFHSVIVVERREGDGFSIENVKKAVEEEAVLQLVIGEVKGENNIGAKHGDMVLCLGSEDRSKLERLGDRFKSQYKVIKAEVSVPFVIKS
eukprot:TRINITY_DN5868_c0_g1_i2.p1 TRINITY_DN5868_c0_g1~~TRINITY_DN5868_c0_g1_i2.p1  ORF type:complete len:197 (+),score=52.55 TRINITY_DN5868_c0_g1_i2:168-758(+)